VLSIQKCSVVGLVERLIEAVLSLLPRSHLLTTLLISHVAHLSLLFSHLLDRFHFSFTEANQIMSHYGGPPNQYGGDYYGQQGHQGQGQGYYPPQQGHSGPPPQGYYPPDVSHRDND